MYLFNDVFEKKKKVNEENCNALVADYFNEKRDCMIRWKSAAVTSATKDKVYRGYAVAGGFLFTTAAVARSCARYDDNLPRLFFGEEVFGFFQFNNCTFFCF